MRGLYLDCFSGISGDMLLGALVDLGVEAGYLRAQLRKLPLGGYAVASSRVTRARLAGTKIDVRMRAAHQGERGIREITRIIQRSRLSAEVRSRALAAFDTLVDAEARVHRIRRERVHLHEVGAVDAIVDIVGAMIGLERLGWPRVVCSPLHVGRGMVTMEHGTFPVPPPAVAEILKGRPCYATEVEGELVTPTGAALAVTLASDFGPLPSMRLQKVGYGAGSREYDHHPNLLRALYGDLLNDGAIRETVLVLETTIDDMNPQIYGHLMERLFAAGALEVFYTPIQMKKNRPGTLVTVICPEPRFEAVGSVIFRETTTIGFRYLPMGRFELGRRIETVATPYGRVRMKVSLHGGEVVQATPEYEDCRAAALATGVPLKEVQRLAAARFPSGRAPAGRSAARRSAAGRRAARRGGGRARRPARRHGRRGR
ncbi:MAG TPA: nickel pincer cofactor biosynthesis protein LarC [Candidatus Polarisedimenticolia bacterium]|nr:nickel pincer cofactor biosynthesis protein LarC [Candidatus Polarisedimenticolia bacterium]